MQCHWIGGASEAGATPHIFGALFHEVVHEQLLTKKNMPLDFPHTKIFDGAKIITCFGAGV